MGTELSAEFVIFEPDDVLLDYVRARNPAPFTPQWPDADADYKERRALDLGAIEPLVALPDAVVNNSVPVGEVAGEQIDQAFIGSCANGTLDDLAVAAKVVAGRRVAPGVRFIVTPGSQAIYRDALAAGYVATLVGGRRGGHHRDLRRLRRRAYGRARAGRDLHHRQHAQLQGPHGRSRRRASTWPRPPPSRPRRSPGRIASAAEFFAGDLA